jgi:ribonuclease BN (tRNA processing enzyme)
MKLTFLGTRGNIKSKTKKHNKHTSLLISYKKKSIIIDRGEDWLNKPYKFQVDAIVATHSHPDHIGGLKNGALARYLLLEKQLKN